MTTVLLVERNDQLRGMLRSRFLREGFLLREASSAFQAITMARAERPDLIVLDAGITSDDGVRMHQVLSADEELRHVPVILLSARARAEVGADGVAAVEPADAPRLEHPFRPGHLLELARGLVRAARRPGGR